MSNSIIPVGCIIVLLVFVLGRFGLVKNQRLLGLPTWLSAAIVALFVLVGIYLYVTYYPR